MYWPQVDSGNQEVEKIRKKYEKRNPSQIYNRTVKHANEMLKDLRYVFEYLPDKYLEQVDIESGLRYLNLEASQTQPTRRSKFRIAFTQVKAGLKTLSELVQYNDNLSPHFKPQIQATDRMVAALYEISRMEKDVRSRKPGERRSTQKVESYSNTNSI